MDCEIIAIIATSIVFLCAIAGLVFVLYLALR